MPSQPMPADRTRAEQVVVNIERLISLTAAMVGPRRSFVFTAPLRSGMIELVESAIAQALAEERTTWIDRMCGICYQRHLDALKEATP